MKKHLSLLMVLALAAATGFAQIAEDTIYQPTHVVARRIDDAGQTTNEITFDYSYDNAGRLSFYECPDYQLTRSLSYSNNFLMQENILHNAGEHPLYETVNYTYENGLLTSMSQLVSNMGTSQYWIFSYYDDGKLKRKDHKDEVDDDYHEHWMYEYGEDGKTVVESYWTSWLNQGMLLRKKSTSQFDESYNLVSKHDISYDTEGNTTNESLTTYTYTPTGNIAKETTQKPTEGEWGNSSIVTYEYDDQDHLTTKLNGTWNQESGEWNFTRKTTFDLNEEEGLYTVSFYKKQNGNWVWDVFNNQTILFGNNLKNQQKFLIYMVYAPFQEPANINQFEFTLAQTEVPTYEDVEDNKFEACHVHPNPTSGLVTITGKDLRQAEVFNALGQRVATATGEGETLQVDIAKLPAGVYFVNVTDKDGRKCVRKVVKE